MNSYKNSLFRQFALSTLVVTLASLMPQAASAITPEELVKRQARSIHLTYSPAVKDAVAAVGTVKVVETQTNSYFCILGWDCGYCGIQDKGAAGKILIFSVWDPGDQHDYGARPENVKEELRAKVLYSRADVDVARFGGEGTGARTITPIGWKVGAPVTVKIETAADGTNRTAYTCFYKNPADGAWQRIATVSTLVREGRARGLNWVHSFIEDFWRNGYSATLSRRAEFYDFATRGADPEKWTKATQAYFSGDTTPADTVDAGKLPNGAFFMQTGGATKNEHVKLWSTVE